MSRAGVNRERPPKPIRFRLYPENKSLYFVVNVWPCHTSMIRYLESIGKKGYEDAGAICSGQRRYRIRPGVGDRLSPHCGELNFHQGQIDAETISHEITHAAIEWAKRIKLDPMTVSDTRNCSDENERFCYALGRMVGQFSHRAYRRKVWSYESPKRAR